MDKIAVGPGYAKGVVDLDAPPEENIRNLARAKGMPTETITAMILDRPRHADLIAAVRRAGGSVSLITDGDVAGVIHTAEPDKTGIDIYLGIGEYLKARARCGGRRAASAGRCSAASSSTPRKSASASAKMGIKDPRKKYAIEDMVRATACSPRPGADPPTAACWAA